MVRVFSTLGNLCSSSLFTFETQRTKLSLAVKVQHINKECGKAWDSRESKVLKGKEGSQRGNPVKQKRKESSLLCLSFTHLLLFSFITPSYQFIQMTIDRITFSISTAIIVLCHLLGHINQRTMKWVSVFGLLNQRLNTCKDTTKKIICRFIVYIVIVFIVIV